MLTGIKTLGHSGPGSNDNEGITPHSRTGAMPSDAV